MPSVMLCERLFLLPPSPFCPVPTVASIAAAVSSACFLFPHAAGLGVGKKPMVELGDCKWGFVEDAEAPGSEGCGGRAMGGGATIVIGGGGGLLLR